MTPTLTAVALKIAPAPAKPLTVNAAHRMRHWAPRAAIVRSWRGAAKIYAKADKLPRFAWVEIDADITQVRGVLADAGAHHLVVKAIIDGLVEAGVIANDSPEFVHPLVQHPPTRGADSVTIRLRGELLS